jgi:hypothetical protein
MVTVGRTRTTRPAATGTESTAKSSLTLRPARPTTTRSRCAPVRPDHLRIAPHAECDESLPARLQTCWAGAAVATAPTFSPPNDNGTGPTPACVRCVVPWAELGHGLSICAYMHAPTRLNVLGLLVRNALRRVHSRTHCGETACAARAVKILSCAQHSRWVSPAPVPARQTSFGSTQRRRAPMQPPSRLRSTVAL